MLTQAGRVALVTGAASGVGRAVAEALAGCGAHVVGVDRDERVSDVMAGLATPAGNSPAHMHFVGDVSDEGFVETAFEAACGPCWRGRRGEGTRAMASADPADPAPHRGIRRRPRARQRSWHHAGRVSGAAFGRELERVRRPTPPARLGPPRPRLNHCTVSRARRVMEVNLRGSFLTTRALARHVAARSKAGVGDSGDRAVVNVSSVVGKCGNVGQANCARNRLGTAWEQPGNGRLTLFHSATPPPPRCRCGEQGRRDRTHQVGSQGNGRFATTHSTRTRPVMLSLPARQGPLGIRVNAVQPGFVATPMTEAVPERVTVKMQAQIPAGRFGEATEVAEVVEFLASSRASYVTGAVVEVTGGLWM